MDSHAGAWEPAIPRWWGILSLCWLLLLGASPVFAQPQAAASEPLSPLAGVFITSLYGLDLRNQSFNATLWAWFIHPSTEFKPEHSTEILNAHNYAKERFLTMTSPAAADKLQYWSQVKFTGKIAHNWDLSNFPFDRQTFRIVMEDADHDHTRLRYRPDILNSKMDANIQLPDWRVIDFTVSAPTVSYQTTYGDPNLPSGATSTYSQLITEITLERKGMRLFFNMFTALYIAFVLTSVAFLIPLENIMARIALTSASIFATIGSKYVVDSIMPPTTSLTLVDKIQILTFCLIGIMVIVTVSYSQFSAKHGVLIKKINARAGILLPLLYIALNVYWVGVALTMH